LNAFRSAQPISRIRRKLPVVLFLSVAALLALHCYRTPRMSVDLLSYAGNVALIEKKDVVLAHQSVYGERMTPHLRGTDSDGAPARILRRRASDPYYSATYLPYFSVKPLYLMTLGLVHRAGLDLTNSIRLVSALCYFGIVMLLSATLVFLSVFCFALSSHYGYGWKSLYFHTFIAGDPTAPPYFAWSNYQDALKKGLGDLSRSAVPPYALLAIVSFVRSSERSIRTILGLSGFYLVSRFLLFPSYESRFYGLFYVCTGIAAVSALSGAAHSGKRGRDQIEVADRQRGSEATATAA
jgi:hypothetical protein